MKTSRGSALVRREATGNPGVLLKTVHANWLTGTHTGLWKKALAWRVPVIQEESQSGGFGERARGIPLLYHSRMPYFLGQALSPQSISLVSYTSPAPDSEGPPTLLTQV